MFPDCHVQEFGIDSEMVIQTDTLCDIFCIEKCLLHMSVFFELFYAMMSNSDIHTAVLSTIVDCCFHAML